MKNIDEKLIGQAIRKFRRERKLSQQSINDAMGKGASWLSDVEPAKQTITFNDVLKLCDIMNVDIDELTDYVMKQSK